VFLKNRFDLASGILEVEPGISLVITSLNCWQRLHALALVLHRLHDVGHEWSAPEHGGL
jgi:hypothetical protein